MNKVGNSTGRKCCICDHPEAAKINSAIAEGKSFRDISIDVQGDNKKRMSIRRHAEGCLRVGIAAIIHEKKYKQAIDVHKQFEDNLAFAIKIRDSIARRFSDPDNPPKMNAIPNAVHAIKAVNLCVEQFAKIAGLYTKDKDNPTSITAAVKWYDEWLARNPYANAQEKADAVIQFARGGQLDPRELADRAGVPLLTQVTQ